MQQIQAFGADYDEYRRDESRVQGEAESISFPTTEDEVSAILSKLTASDTAVTVQGLVRAWPRARCRTVGT